MAEDLGEEGGFDLDDLDEETDLDPEMMDEETDLDPEGFEYARRRIPPKQFPSWFCPRCPRGAGGHCISTCWWNNPHDKWCHAHEKGRQCWKNNRYYRCRKHNWLSQYWKHEYCK